MTTWVSGDFAEISAVASSPSIPGIRTSIKTTSGRSRDARSIASAPLLALPTTSNPSPERNSPSVSQVASSLSTISTRTWGFNLLPASSRWILDPDARASETDLPSSSWPSTPRLHRGPGLIEARRRRCRFPTPRGSPAVVICQPVAGGMHRVGLSGRWAHPLRLPLDQGAPCRQSTTTYRRVEEFGRHEHRGRRLAPNLHHVGRGCRTFELRIMRAP